MFGATNVQIACPCVFKTSGWVQCSLLAKEVLRAFDIPLNMDAVLLEVCRERHIRGLLFQAITPLVVTSIFRALWSKSGGVEGDVPVIQQELPEHATGAVDNSELDRNEKGDIDIGAPSGDMDMIDSSEGVHKGQLEAEENTSSPEEEDARLQLDKEVLFKWVAWGWSNTTRHDFGIHQDVPQRITIPETSLGNGAVASAKLCDYIKEEYDVAKA